MISYGGEGRTPKIAQGAAIGSGSVLAGLRGSAFTTASTDGKRNMARVERTS